MTPASRFACLATLTIAIGGLCAVISMYDTEAIREERASAIMLVVDLTAPILPLVMTLVWTVRYWFTGGVSIAANGSTARVRNPIRTYNIPVVQIERFSISPDQTGALSGVVEKRDGTYTMAHCLAGWGLGQHNSALHRTVERLNEELAHRQALLREKIEEDNELRGEDVLALRSSLSDGANPDESPRSR